MKYVTNILGGLLGLLFIAASVTVLFNLAPAQPAPPEGSPPALFMGAFMPTGYMTFVKVLELIGGVLVAIPKTRNFGLLILGPIIINIIAYHTFITKGEGLLSPMLIGICLIALFLLLSDRKRFAGLLR